MRNYNVTEEYKRQLKEKEGFRSEEYWDRNGMAWGYGSHSNRPNDNPTREDADKQFEKDIQPMIKRANKLLDVDLTQGQFNVVVDMMYNVGEGNMKQAFDRINRGQIREMGEKLSEYNLSTDKKTGKREVLPALVKRAAWRKEMWDASGEIQVNRNDELDAKAVPPQSLDLFSTPKKEYDLPTDIKSNKDFEGRARNENVTSGVSDEAYLQAIQKDEPEQEQDLTGVSDDDYLKAIQNNPEKEEFAEPIEPRTPEPIFDGVSRLETAEVLSKDLDINHGKQTRQVSKSKRISEDKASAYVSSPDFSQLEKHDSRRDLSNLHSDLVNWGSRPENFKLLEQDTSGLQLIAEEALSWRIGIDAGKRAFINAGVYSSIFAENNGLVDRGTLTIDEMRQSVRGLGATYQARGTRKIDRAMTRTSRSFGKTVDIASELLGIDNEEEIADASVLHLLKQTGTTFGEVFNTLGTFASNKKALGMMMAQSMESSLLPMAGAIGGGIVGGYLYGSATAGTLTQMGVTHGRIAGGLSASYVNAYGIYYSELVDKAIQNGLVKSYSEFQQNKNRRDDAHKKSTRYAAVQSPIQVAGQMLAGRYMSKYVRPDVILGKQTAKQIAKGAASKVAGKGTVLAQEAGQGSVFNFMEELFPRLVAGENLKTAVGEATTEVALGGPSSAVQSMVGFTFNELSDNGGFVYRRRVKKLYYKMAKVMDASKDMASYERLKEAYTKSATAKQYDEQVGDLANEASAKKVEVAPAPAESEAINDVDAQPSSDEMRVQQKEISNGDGEQYIRFVPDEMIAILEEEGLDVEDVIQELGPEFAEDFKQAFIEGGEVKVKVTDFLSKVEDDSRFKGIMRFGENELSANDVIESEGSYHTEVQEIIKKSEDAAEGEVTLAEDQRVTPAQAKARAERWQDVPLDERPKVITPNGNIIDGDVVLRQMKIMQKYKLDAKGKQVLASTLKQAADAVSKVDYMTPAEKEGFVPLLAEQHFNHIAMRARVTGQTIEEVGKTMVLRGETAAERRKTLKAAGSGRSYGIGALYSGAGLYEGLQNMTLVLSAHADISTMTHELGHAWLYDMMFDWDQMHTLDVDQMNQEQKDYLQAMDETAKLLNIESLGSFLRDAERSQHLLNQGKSKSAEYKRLRRERLEGQEAFAQTAEKYLLDGEFKNAGTRKIFMVMQSFMQNLLGRGRDIGGGYASEGVFPLRIDPVVESIFETILGAREMAQEAMESMHPQMTINPEDFGKDAQAFMDAYNEAAEDTEAAIVSRLIIRKGRQQEKEQNATIDKAFDEAEGIINEAMPNQVRIALQKIGKEDPTLRISEKSFSEAYSEKYGSDWRKKIPKGIVNGKNKKGVDLAEVIAVFTPMIVEGENEVVPERDFFEVLIEAGAKDDRIEELASDIIQRQNIPNLTEQEIFDIAVEEAGGVRRDIFLRRSFDFMMKKYKKEFKKIAGAVMTPEAAQSKILKENVKVKAETIVDADKYKGFDAKKYYKLSVQKGKAAGKAWTKSDIIGAINLKIEEIQHGEAFRYAEKQAKLVAKATLNLKKVAAAKLANVANAFETDIYVEAQALIHTFNSGQPLQHLEVDSKDVDSAGYKFPNIVGEIWVQSMNDRIDNLKDKIDEEGIGSPSISTVLTLNKIVEGIRKAAREAKKLESNGKKLSLSLEQGKFANQIGPRKKGDLKKAPVAGRKGTDLLWERFWAPTRKVETVLAGIFKDDAAWISSVPGRMFSEIKNAESARSVSQQDAKMRISKRIKTAAKANKKNKVRMKNITSKVLKYTFKTKEEIYVFLANMGSESSLEALALGGTEEIGPMSHGIDPNTGRIDDRKMWEAIQEMVDNGDLSMEDVLLVQEVLDAFKPYHAAVDQATKDVKGYRVGKIEARPFSLVFDGKPVTFEGGYFPLTKSSLDRKYTVGDRLEDAGSNSSESMYPFMNMGLVKQRRKNPFKISLSWDSAVNMGLKNTTRIAFMLKPMHNFAKFMNGGEVHAALENRFPSFYRSTLVPWYQRTTDQMYTPTEAFDADGLKMWNSVAQFVRTNMRAHWYFAKFATGAVQTIGFAQAAHAVGYKRMMKHIQISASNFTKNKKHIIEVSPRMRDRFDMNESHRVADMDDITLSTSLWTKSVELQRRMNFVIIQTMQNYVDVGVYMAAEEKAVEMGLKGADIDAFASRTVDRTQGSAVISDRVNLQDATPFEKLAQGFTDIPMMLLHQFKLEWLRTQGEPMPEKVRRRAYILLTTAIVPALVLESMKIAGEEFVGAIFDDGDEDEEDKLKKYHQSVESRLALRVINEGLDIGIPIGGKYLAEAVNYVADRPASFRPSAELSTISQLGRKAGLSKIGTDVDFTLEEIVKGLGLLTIATGFPLLPLAARTVELYDKLIESEDSKEERSERILEQKVIEREQKLEELDERGLL